MKAGIDYIGVSVGALIFNEKGEVLLLKRSQNAKNEKGKWEAPGGAVDFWEKREEALKREMEEELGVEVEIVDLIHVIDELLDKDKQHWVGTSYIAKIKGNKRPRIAEPHKHDDIGWFDINDLPNPLSWVSQKDIEVYKKKFRK